MLKASFESLHFFKEMPPSPDIPHGPAASEGGQEASPGETLQIALDWDSGPEIPPSWAVQEPRGFGPST